MTNINAYYAHVEEKRAKVAEAQSELKEAVAALRAHPDYEEPEVKAEPAKAEVKSTAKGKTEALA